MSTAIPAHARALTVLLAVGAAGCAAASEEVVVSAAASLRPALEEAARAYAGDGGARVLVNAASSSSLARQIVEGAPVDVFISADAAQMAAVARAGRIVAGTRVDLLSNQLALVAPAGGSLDIESLADLADPDVRRIGMGDPAAVPVGVYARELLEAHGLWERLREKVVPGGSVEMTLAAAESGNVDVAFVYLTDARRSRRVRILMTITAGQGPRIVYPAAVVTGGRNQAGGRRFLEYLSGEGRAVLAAHGFGTP